MRKGLKEVSVAVVLLTLVLSLALLVGCGEKKTTVVTPEGEVTVNEKDGKVTVSGEDGDSTYEWSDKEPTEAELGVAIYPGAKYVEGSGGSGSVSSAEGVAAVVGAEFTTTDSFTKVVEWYTGKLGAPVMSTSDEASWMAGVDMMNPSAEIGEFSTVAVTQENGKVKIAISRMGGAGK